MDVVRKSTSKRSQNITWYITLIIILLASLIIWAAITLRENLFTEVLLRNDPVSILITVDDGNQPMLTSLLMFDPGTYNGALISIPKDTGGLLSTLDRVDRLETLYEPENLELYSDSVAKLFGNPVDFTVRMHLNEFERLVDQLGGITIFIPNAVEDEIDGRLYLFPPGGVILDGAKARSYVEYRPSGETQDERRDREHRIIQSLLKGIGENIDLLLSESVFPYLVTLLDSNFDTQSYKAFFHSLAEIDADRLVFQGILGNRRTIDGELVLFPYYEGKLLRETLQRIRDNLTRENNFGEVLLTIRIEIENGTEVNGLATRTAQLYRSYGFNVVSIGNADHDDYKRTLVLDRQGNPDAAGRVAELIRTDQIHSRIDDERDETVDVTVILGKDFDGRYVKN